MHLDTRGLEQKEEDTISVRLAQSKAEVDAAQRLRYQDFYEEYKATPNREMAAARLDIDDYDRFADHLIVIDRSAGFEKIVGTYRLLRQEAANTYGKFY